MLSDKGLLKVYETGPLTVIGFGGREILDQINLSDCRGEILQLVEQHQTKTLAVDLTGVLIIPSGMLGLLASLRNQGIEVQLYNPSPDIVEVLEVTRLNELMPVHHIDLPSADSP
jgi:anti-sigma B factor antagonist